MTTETARATRRVVTYERVSSDDQRQRRTIMTQTDELARQLQNEPGVRLFTRYIDDGISGTIPMAKRPAGRRLMEDAAKGLFDEVWVYKVDRLGRDAIDPLTVWRDLETLGIKVHSVTEGISDPFMYQIHVAMAAKERRTFLERSAAGMERIVKNGQFPGGICPLGYEVVGKKNEAHLVTSTRVICESENWTAADLIYHIYDWLGVQGWSCPRIADHLNAIGVPTAYQHRPPGQSRAERKTGLQAKWRAGRIRNLVALTVYKGVYQYGKRSGKKGRPIWEVPAPRLVSDELWQVAQDALARNRIIAKNTPCHYLLTGLMKCGVCGKSYCATHGRGHLIWWRCNGKMLTRYDAEDRCQSKSVKGNEIETTVWQDIERWLNDPGDLIRELEDELDRGKAKAAVNEERTILEGRLIAIDVERKGYLRQNAKGILGEDELKGFLDELAQAKAIIDKRLHELQPTEEQADALPANLLEEVRSRVKDGLTEEQKQEIARLLVKKITITTKTEAEDTRRIAEIAYRFPVGAVNYDRDTGSWRRQARSC